MYPIGSTLSYIEFPVFTVALPYHEIYKTPFGFLCIVKCTVVSNEDVLKRGIVFPLPYNISCWVKLPNGFMEEYLGVKKNSIVWFTEETFNTVLKNLLFTKIKDDKFTNNIFNQILLERVQ